MNLTDEQLDRYARHIVLRDVGGRGQKKLLGTKVLVVGAGGLGSPMLLYLAAAGVGTLGIIDDDNVDLSNLQRQIAHETADIDRAKVKSAQASIERLNPDIKVVPYQTRLNSDNAQDVLSEYDLVADGTDNFETRFLLNDTCFFLRKPLVSGAMLQFEGQISTYKAYEEGNNPCYRCVFPAPPPPEIAQTCGEAGVLGALAGVIGSLQAIEIIKEILGVGDSLSGRLLLYDALSTEFRKIKISRDPACALCGSEATFLRP
ncbi:molybdopterin-synthase adenylyltransferase MoeB [Sneathiella marina]|uniref:Molybdopterin-synthase adenylyltransferase MoeB n=1 Tax=Sneathiella marina TaxID=2950108 RepID=A0ABY4W9M6_9PROT|nr:molybdopterin-synthase adenylyltransferase MoeB [Sneathiella marina]USG61346.1 molybdopterin-synthase adenylyltransferase MoeB [Sneathiella marina]